jgi:hypothetical protein
LTVTGGVSVTSLRPATALNGPRVATTVNEEVVLRLFRRKTILKAPVQDPLHCTAALFTVPFALA